MFYCCRTALRTQAGLAVAELLLPFLVLDRLCFGNGQDHAVLLNEIRDVLTYCDDEGVNIGSPMTSSEKRNAVSTVFSLLDLLQRWVEPEVESKYWKKSRSPGKEPEPPVTMTICDWQLSESAMRIEDLMGKIPLQLRGNAACKVGMYSTALRFLEMASRSTVVDAVFGMDAEVVTQRKPNRSRAAGKCPEEVVDLLKDILASLDDYETIEALVGDYNWVAPEAQTKGSIRQKESLQDWQGALHEYERAQQNVCDSSIRLGTLRCLLQLGHFDSVLQQVNYMQFKTSADQTSPEDFAEAVPIAAEAACRLGRWEALSELVEEATYRPGKPVSSDSSYQVHLGKALLNVKRKSLDGALKSLNHARRAVMENLENVARESYSRSYDHLVRLQALRDIEDVSEVLCAPTSSHPARLMQDNTLAWNRRLDLVSSSGATTILNVRLVLARLANDSAFEGSLFLRMGKRARKSGLLSAAANSFSQAEAAFRCVDDGQKAKWKSALVLQTAKLNHSAGESSIALRMLGLDDVESMGVLKDEELVSASIQRVVENMGIDKHEMNEKEILGIFVQNALQSTRWMIEGGLKEAAEIVSRFRVIHRIAPSFEKGKDFCFTVRLQFVT
jgi:serine/threonine-protein kinase ATR